MVIMIHRHTRLALALSLFLFFYYYAGPTPGVVEISFLIVMAFWVLGTFFIYNHDGSDK